MAFIPANIGGGGGTGTNLTPSNSTPAQITSGNDYHATGNGYAIESYDSVTPSSTPESVSSGDIVKIGGSGVIVDSVPTPTSITPSNSNPVPMYENTAYEPTVRGIAIADFINATPSNSSPQSLVSGNIYKSQGNGYGIASYNSITPSNSSPVSLSSGAFYKPSASGYAISSYSSKTPSDTSPASVSSGAIVKASSSGYLFKNNPPTKTQTTLWTNNSPTSAFGETTVSLSNSINNYALIGIKFRASTSDSATTEIIVSPTDLAKSVASASRPRVVIGANNSSGNRYDRGVAYNSATSLTISNAFRVNAAANSSSVAIPINIYGYNF